MHSYINSSKYLIKLSKFNPYHNTKIISSHFHVNSFQLSRFIRNRMLLIQFFQWIEHSGHQLTVLVGSVQKVNNLTDRRVFYHNHVLGNAFEQTQNASLSVKPCVSVQFLRNWLKGLDDSTHSKIIVSLRAIQRADY